MANKNKISVELSIDEDLYKKLRFVSNFEKLTENNYMIKLIRNSVAYHERVHGRIDTSKIQTEKEQ